LSLWGKYDNSALLMNAQDACTHLLCFRIMYIVQSVGCNLFTKGFGSTIPKIRYSESRCRLCNTPTTQRSKEAQASMPLKPKKN